MDSRPTQAEQELCDALARALEIADRQGNSLASAMLCQMIAALGCPEPDIG